MREGRFGFILSLFIFVYFCNSLSNCEEDGKSRQTFVIRYKDGEQTIPVTVVLDYRKQTEYVINMNPRSPAKSVTLYDFKQKIASLEVGDKHDFLHQFRGGMEIAFNVKRNQSVERTIAYKDLTNRECFLGRLTNETLSEESHALQDVKNPVEVRPKIRSLDPKTPALTPTEIRNLAGQKTAVFCRKMNTWLLMPERAHRISKREAEDDFEERTLEYHGHRSHQYSHFERETRRRIRNRNQSNHKRRSRTREGAAVHKNGDLISEQNSSPRHLQRHNDNGSYINPVHFESLHDISNQTQSQANVVPHSSYSSVERNPEEEKENLYNEVYFPKRESFGRSKTKLHDYSDSGTKSRQTEDVSKHSDPNFPRSNETNGTANLEYELLSKDALKNFEKSNPSAKFVSEDTETRTEVVATTTETTSGSNSHKGLSHPNVHSSLAHLLPVYKPSGQEHYDQNTRAENKPSQIFNKHSDLESEVYPSLPTHAEPENRPVHLGDFNDTSHERDGSANVFQIPRTSKEFENFQNKESHVSVSQPKSNRRFHSSQDNYPILQRSHSGSLPDIHHNNLNKVSGIHSGHEPLSTNINRKNGAKEISVNGDNINHPQIDISTTTELPVHTTLKYFFRARTTPYPSYIPSVHTAFQNSEDFNSFLIFPNDLESRNFHSPTEASSNVETLQDNRSKIKSSFRGRTPQDLLLTTKHPLLEDRRNTDMNHRSDIPSDDNYGNLRSNNHFLGNKQKTILPFNINNDTSDIVPSHKIRYQNALFGFKPDEIVIDIGNVATHSPTPVTATFDRTTTTTQPTTRSVPIENRRIYNNRRNEQVAGPSFRSFIPSTRYPRRRINDKSQRPVVHSGTISVPQRVPLNQNHHNLRPSPQINQLYGVNQFPSTHRTNRRQFYHPSQPIPPTHVRMPIDMNQFHHNRPLVNLPPGVSIHPRHPQAPFADMVHSNRPPTMPVLENGDEYLKPHRQRHHRKKDRHLNSCCRLRGNAAAFQSCCRNGGPCCSSARRRLQPQNSSCCSSPKSNERVLPPVRTANKILPPVRIEGSHRSEVDNRDRCQKEKMCRTLYESTQQVMVCRNAHVDGC